jgi:pseudouridine synthase
MRLNKFLASHGVGARRKCDDIIREGRVTVNGRTVREFGIQLREDQDIVEVDGKRIGATGGLVYILINKPAGYVVTAKDPHNRPTVFHLLQGVQERVFSVGRLDVDVGGALLLTNDGELSFRLTHPRYEVEKVYRVHVQGKPDHQTVRSIQTGLHLDDGRTAPMKVRIVGGDEDTTVCEMTMHEGRKRQVKRMWARVGHPVLALQRIQFAGLTLHRLRSGEWRYLAREDIEKLKESAGIPT